MLKVKRLVESVVFPVNEKFLESIHLIGWSGNDIIRAYTKLDGVQVSIMRMNEIDPYSYLIGRVIERFSGCKSLGKRVVLIPVKYEDDLKNCQKVSSSSEAMARLALASGLSPAIQKKWAIMG